MKALWFKINSEGRANCLGFFDSKNVQLRDDTIYYAVENYGGDTIGMIQNKLNSIAIYPKGGLGMAGNKILIDWGLVKHIKNGTLYMPGRTWSYKNE